MSAAGIKPSSGRYEPAVLSHIITVFHFLYNSETCLFATPWLSVSHADRQHTSE